MMLIIPEFRLTVERFPRSVLFPDRSFCNGCDIATEMTDCQYSSGLGAEGARRMKKEIVTRRFVLREFQPGDVDQFVAYQTDPGFSIFHHEDELGNSHAHGVFQLFLDWQESAPRYNYQFAISLLNDDANLIGSCGIR